MKENRAMATPWPIETKLHPPLRPDYKTGEFVGSHEHEHEHELDEAQLLKKCFEKPLEARRLFLENVRVPDRDTYDGGSVFYAWLNKSCPVGCPDCFYRSSADEKPSPETHITKEGIDRLIRFSNASELDKFVISGGGEPMSSRQEVYELVKEVRSKQIVVITSGFFARSGLGCEKYLRPILENAAQNQNRPDVTLRLSVDEGHVGKLDKNGDFEYIKRIIAWMSENASMEDGRRLGFAIHTMDGDETVEELLSELPVESRTDKGEEPNRSTEIRLKDGCVFKIEYSQLYQTDPQIDLDDRKKLLHNFKTFWDFLLYRRDGGMSVQNHEDGTKGLYYTMTYDGTIGIWGSTPPDKETTIYESEYQRVKESSLDDILCLANLERGPIYVQNIVAEVNPNAVKRAIGAGLRDFYARMLWEEDTTRTYASIRVVQDYLRLGRIPEEQMNAWPPELRSLITASKEDLVRAYDESSFTIVHQYLEDPDTSAEKLTSLFELVQRKHYKNIDQERMIQIVSDSKIDPEIKSSFYEMNGIRPGASESGDRYALAGGSDEEHEGSEWWRG